MEEGKLRWRREREKLDGDEEIRVSAGFRVVR